MIRAFRKWLDKIPSSPGIMNTGQWRVRYFDGSWTLKMTHDCALAYAASFGGIVYWVRYDDPHQKEVRHD